MFRRRKYSEEQEIVRAATHQLKGALGADTPALHVNKPKLNRRIHQLPRDRPLVPPNSNVNDGDIRRGHLGNSYSSRCYLETGGFVRFDVVGVSGTGFLSGRGRGNE